MKQARNLFVVLIISCVGFLFSAEARAAATPSFTISVTASPASVAAKQSEALTVTATSSLAASGYNIALTVTTSGVQETSKTYSSLTFKANTALTETDSWTVPSTAPTGIYTVTASVKKSSTVYATATTTFTVISNGACGSSNNANLTSAPTTNLCSIGTASTVSGTGPWNWTCAGVGGSTASCLANLKVNGTCGPSNKTTLSSAPTTGLCNTGTATTVTGTGPWKWSCTGIHGGTTQSCSASLAIAVNGACGTSNGANLTSTPTTGLCSKGTASAVAGTGPWNWNCIGSNNGTTAPCSANLVVNGACGPANNVAVSSTPTTGLCNSSATTPVVTGTGPWTWSCTGANTGTTQNCSAPLFGAPVNGACGAANGVAALSAPTANLCNSTGTTPTVTGSGPWAWTCTGTFGGSDQPCSAPLSAANCTFAASAAAQGLTDGCADAPTGTPQFPNLLSSYGTKRPTWDVAGVDYYVGAPAVASLADPTTTALPSGCSHSGNIVTCSGNNITINGYDFSLHGGIQLSMSGSNNVVENNNFAAGTNCVDPELIFDASGTWTIKSNSFNGGGTACLSEVNQSSAYGTVVSVNSENSSVVTFTYNYFLDSPQDAVDMSGPSGSSQIIMQYNFWNGLGWTGHPDGYQLCGGNFTNNILGFNTYYEPSNITFGEQPFHVEAQCGSTVTNAVVDYNTLVTPGTCGQGPWPQGCTSSAADIACKQDSGGNTNTGFQAYGNYLDWSGASSALDNGYNCKNTTWGTSAAPNMDMTTGTVIPNPGTN